VSGATLLRRNEWRIFKTSLFKKMRKIVLAFSVLFFATCIYCQQLNQVKFANGTNFSFFSFLTDQGVQIRVSDDGKVLEWGIEVMSDRYNYYAPKLQPFLARIEYFDPQSDSAFRGKVKSIGSCFITYYGYNEAENKRGKLKSIGSLYLDYFSMYDEKILQGKLKLIGSLSLEYYRPFDNIAFRGKLKSIGSSAITYYSAFDDKFNVGKIKSIGSASYLWYSGYDRYARGGLKSNNYRQMISGITYILR
jgi:hypothetical protein